MLIPRFEYHAPADLKEACESLEAVMIMIGRAPQLAGRLLQFRGLQMRFRSTPVDKNPQCPLCGHREQG